jgi:hypothetical protein
MAKRLKTTQTQPQVPLGFSVIPGSLKLLVTKPNANGGEPVVAYRSHFKGTEYFSIRALWFDGQSYQPGKGVSVPADLAVDLCRAIGQLKI